jgi:hypothetical protein
LRCTLTHSWTEQNSTNMFQSIRNCTVSLSVPCMACRNHHAFVSARRGQVFRSVMVRQSYDVQLSSSNCIFIFQNFYASLSVQDDIFAFLVTYRCRMNFGSGKGSAVMIWLQVCCIWSGYPVKGQKADQNCSSRAFVTRSWAYALF